MNKAMPIISFILLSSLLAACHENPLKTHSKTQSATFLIDASHQAEKMLNLSSKTERSAWLACMKGKEESLDCKTLFDAMVRVAKDNKAFATLTRADLMDSSVLATLEERYDELLFNTLFED